MKGSHKIYRRSSATQLMNFQDEDGQAKPYQVKQLLNAIEEEISKEGEEK